MILVDFNLVARRLIAVTLLDLVKNALLVATAERRNTVNECLVEIEVARL